MSALSGKSAAAAAAPAATAAAGAAPPEYLLLCPANLPTSLRLRRELAACGVGCSEAPLGLEVRCAGLDVRALLQVLALPLSPAQRRATRVALIGGGDAADPAALGRAIFNADTLEAALARSEVGWFEPFLGRDAAEALTVHFQPLVQLPPGRLHGYELLCRGVGEDRSTLIPPDQLFGAARLLGRTRDLDLRCRDAALRAAAGAARAGLVEAGATFFINFVPTACGPGGAGARRQLGRAIDVLADAGLSPGRVCFEVVETEEIRPDRELRELLRAYRKAGFRIALDDVGAGYASLLALCELRPDYIKLDGQLVRGAATGALEARLVRDLAEAARQNGIITIAEGIETPEQFAAVQRAGIRITQGYLHGRPRPTPLTDDERSALLARATALAMPEAVTL